MKLKVRGRRRLSRRVQTLDLQHGFGRPRECLRERGVNFNIILRSAFMLEDPKECKKYNQPVSLFLRFWDLRV